MCRCPALLTDRELNVLALIAEGNTNSAIARSLHLSAATVKTHVAHLMHKLKARDRAHAVALAYRSGHVTVPGPPTNPARATQLPVAAGA